MFPELVRLISTPQTTTSSNKNPCKSFFRRPLLTIWTCSYLLLTFDWHLSVFNGLTRVSLTWPTKKDHIFCQVSVKATFLYTKCDLPEMTTWQMGCVEKAHVFLAMEHNHLLSSKLSHLWWMGKCPYPPSQSTNLKFLKGWARSLYTSNLHRAPSNPLHDASGSSCHMNFWTIELWQTDLKNESEFMRKLMETLQQSLRLEVDRCPPELFSHLIDFEDSHCIGPESDGSALGS